MNQHNFDLLLQRYLAGECNEEESRQVEEWASYRLENSESILTVSEKKAVEKRLWNRLKTNTIRSTTFWRERQTVWVGIAASLLLVSIVWFYKSGTKQSLHSGPVHASVSSDLVVQRTEAGESSRRIILEDGSEIVLSQGSQLSYPPSFRTDLREVYLTGEAFFNVRKDASRPFMVYAGDLTTQVLGTSFSVRSSETGTVEVRVVSGRVSVFENRHKGPQTRNGIILNPNQKIVFNRETRQLVPELVESPAMVQPPAKPEALIFDEVPLPEVLAAIERIYKVEILVEAPVLNQCLFTGDLNELSLHTQLDLIGRSVNGGYELRGTTFFLHGDGCPP